MQEGISTSLKKAVTAEIEKMDILEMESDDEIFSTAAKNIRQENPDAFDSTNTQDCLIFKLLGLS
jgi:hypothetical protein